MHEDLEQRVIVCRAMAEGDTAAVAALSSDLGYPTTKLDVDRRFEALQRQPANGMFIASINENVVGWVHVYGVHLLETDGYAEIGGIVTSTASRRMGIGRALLLVAQNWASQHGYAEVRLRSGLHRDEAHAFYLACGYQQAKASYMFRIAVRG